MNEELKLALAIFTLIGFIFFQLASCEKHRLRMDCIEQTKSEACLK